MPDNKNEIEEKFYIEYGDKSRFTTGWAWKCKECKIVAASEETWFPCKNDFVPTSIKCMKCDAHWVLNIIPDDVPKTGTFIN